MSRKIKALHYKKYYDKLNIKLKICGVGDFLHRICVLESRGMKYANRSYYQCPVGCSRRCDRGIIRAQAACKNQFGTYQDIWCLLNGNGS